PADVRGLGEAPDGPQVAARLQALAAVVGSPLPTGVPALVRAAVVHGELLAVRPFERGNGPVARAVFRLLLTVDGVDPVGVVVPHRAWSQAPMAYASAAAGFATGEPARVAAWVRGCADAVVLGAQQGRAVADAVLAGRLTGTAPDGTAPDGAIGDGQGA
ncbi:hypothetical protein N869_07645, partial [Cellulomonas bogoriensis 69B4 = DSM 16987]